MSKYPIKTLSGVDNIINRDLSWLHFNHRVLKLSGSVSVPILERLRFLSIFTSNLDEFFMARVGHLLHQLAAANPHLSGSKHSAYQDLLYQISQEIPPILLEKHHLYQGICHELQAYGLENIPMRRLTCADQDFLSHTYKSSIQPALSPCVVQDHSSFPHLENLRPAVAVHLQNIQRETFLGIIPFPEKIPVCFQLPNCPGRYLSLEQLLVHHISEFFPEYQMIEHCVIRITRNADLPLLENETHPSKIEQLLYQRTQQEAVRLELSKSISSVFLNQLLSGLHLRRYQVYEDFTPLNLRDLVSELLQMPPQNRTHLFYPAYQPQLPPGLSLKDSMFAQIQQQDRLIFYPFHSVRPFLQFLQEAAYRPDTETIQITLYRMAKNSKIAASLCQAARNGKHVVVIMELRARFDESNNLKWARALQEAGCTVTFGPASYKCHSKVCLITLRQGEHIHYFTQIGTGNYCEDTCSQYTDLCYFTSNQEIGQDCASFFRNVRCQTLPGSYKHLWVSPQGIYHGLLKEIEDQIALGSQGYLCIKANAITQLSLIQKLQEANQAGVEIHLIVRGSCCICPGVSGKTDPIHVTSLVGRYLEHARIYCFGRGKHAKYYISSADLMDRNLQRRVEIACPIYDTNLKYQLHYILNTQLEDTVNTQSASFPCARDSHQEFMESSILHTIPIAKKD